MPPSPQVQKLLALISSGTMSQQRLVAMFENAQRYPTISDEERELLVQAVEHQLRERFPKSAKSIFGPVDEKARGLLGGVQDQVASQFDLSANRVLNRVKTGGDMIAGRYHLDVYVSYKDHEGRNVSLDIRQERQLDRPAARVQLRKVHGHDAGQLYERTYELEAFEDAATDYRQHLATLVGAR